MAEDNAPRSVADALAEVTRRQGEEESRHQAELTEVDQEVESLKTAMANLQQQLEALAKFREELVAKLTTPSSVRCGSRPRRCRDERQRSPTRSRPGTRICPRPSRTRR